MFNNKGKIMLIIVCTVVIVFVFATNVSGRLQEKSNIPLDAQPIIPQIETISRAQMAKMISLLEYSKDGVKQLPRVTTYTDTKQDLWYDCYINGLVTMGLDQCITKGNTVFEPDKELTYGECDEIVSVADQVDSREEIHSKLPFLTQGEGSTPIPFHQWLTVYEYLRQTVYERELLETDPKVEETQLYIVGTKETEDTLEPYTAYTDQGIYTFDGLDLTGVVDTKVDVYVKGKEILYVITQTEEEVKLKNVWITKQEDTTITAYINGLEREFKMNNAVSEDLTKKIADLTVNHQKVSKITLKPDVIHGKVLVTTDNSVEIEGYGVLPLDSQFRVYKIYDELMTETSNAILVGYENTDFVVSDGIVCAALITEPMKAQNIRVLLNNTEYTSILHDKIVITSETPFTMEYGETKDECQANQEITIEPGSAYLSAGRVLFKPEKESAKMKVLSIGRSEGTPTYRGTIEVNTVENKLTIINELPLEEYLYAVVPSEMPKTYGVEALKVQTICARSYAYNHLLSNTYSEYGAHVDDSTKFQVYNNHPENEESIQAVKDTYGKVLKYGDTVIFAYYYSTSCGYSANVNSVWLSNESIPYLVGKYQGIDEAVSTAGDKDYSNEVAFRNFITTNTDETLDQEFPWYRWTVEFKYEEIKKLVDRSLSELYKKNKEYVQTEDKAGNYISIPIDTVGTIQSVEVTGRDVSGLVTEIRIKGSKNTVKVRSEAFIRQLFKPIYSPVVRQDGSTVNTLTLLPSTFFVMDEIKDGATTTGIKLSGGGYGHGVGMSQNGVKKMAELGKTYEEILKYYYTGIEIGNIY